MVKNKAKYVCVFNAFAGICVFTELCLTLLAGILPIVRMIVDFPSDVAFKAKRWAVRFQYGCLRTCAFEDTKGVRFRLLFAITDVTDNGSGCFGVSAPSAIKAARVLCSFWKYCIRVLKISCRMSRLKSEALGGTFFNADARKYKKRLHLPVCP